MSAEDESYSGTQSAGPEVKTQNEVEFSMKGRFEAESVLFDNSDSTETSGNL